MNEEEAINRLAKLQAYAALTQVVLNFRNDGFHWAYGLAMEDRYGFSPQHIMHLQRKISAELKELSDGLWP